MPHKGAVLGAQYFETDITEVDEWMGTVRANNIDLARIELLLGIDPVKWWVLAVDVDFHGFGTRTVTALAVPATMTRDQLMQAYDEHRAVHVTAFEAISVEPEHPEQAMGTLPDELPVRTVADFMAYAFERLEMRMHVGWVRLPVDLLLEVTETIRTA